MKLDKITWNLPGFDVVRKSPGVKADLERRATRVAGAAGDGMEPSSMTGQHRARASVITATTRARRAEAKSRALTRALDAARG